MIDVGDVKDVKYMGDMGTGTMYVHERSWHMIDVGDVKDVKYMGDMGTGTMYDHERSWHMIDVGDVWQRFFDKPVNSPFVHHFFRERDGMRLRKAI